MGNKVSTLYSRQGLTRDLYNGSNTSLPLLQTPLLTHPRAHLSFLWLSPTCTLRSARTSKPFLFIISSWWAPWSLVRQLDGGLLLHLFIQDWAEEGRGVNEPATAATVVFTTSQNPVDPQRSRISQKQQHLLNAADVLQEGSQWARNEWENSSGVTYPNP